MKIYVVVETEFEYNDEYYRPQDGSTPVKAYKKQEVADKVCLEKNIEWVSNTDLGNYGYSWREIFDDPDTVFELTGIDVTNGIYETDLSSAFNDLSDEEKLLFLNALNIKPFKVIEVELA